METLRLILHLFLLGVLLPGTLWRLVSYHLIASSEPWMSHLGLAMSQQY